MMPAGMSQQEYERIRELLIDLRPERTLEIGMANGGSSVAICRVLKEIGKGKHIAIDPFQNSPKGWAGRGVENIRRFGLTDVFELIENLDYLALPRLVEERHTFDFILIDGWHSFDYTLLDFFYSDLLLRDGGVLAIHDTSQPAVFKVCGFIDTHKAYELISPPAHILIENLTGRIERRLSQVLAGPAAMREAHQRRTRWHMLVAYRKTESRQVPDDFYAAF
jgi:predicted O-methyltransferase YrrM